VVFYIDHLAIKYLVNKADLSGRIARWVLLLSEFNQYKVEYKPDKMHLQADHLSQLKGEPSMEPIDDNLIDENLFTVSSSSLWCNHITKYLATHEIPESLSKNKRRKIRVNSAHFALIGDRLYRRGVDSVLRRRVTKEEIPEILSACHDSACGGNFSDTLIGQKILRARYY